MNKNKMNKNKILCSISTKELIKRIEMIEAHEQSVASGMALYDHISQAHTRILKDAFVKTKYAVNPLSLDMGVDVKNKKQKTKTNGECRENHLCSL